MSEYVLALDIGSSSVRAGLYDRSGSVHSRHQAQIEYTQQMALDGSAVLDLPTLEQTLVQCLDAALAGCSAGSVAAVGCATLAGNLVGVDANHQPIMPLWTWADTRAVDSCGILRDSWETTKLWERTGCPLHSSYWPARLHWLRHHHPVVFAGVHRWWTLGEYLTWRWTGTPLLSLSLAAWNGMLNRETGAWDAWLLEQLTLRADQLGEPCDPTMLGPTVLPEWAERWPALRDARWLAPVGDGFASNLGCGGIDAQRVVINLGTSGALRVLLPAGGAVPQGLWRYRVATQHELTGGAVSNGGNLIDWASNVLNLPDLEDAERQLHGRVFGSHGLTVRPALAGERSPSYADDARGCIDGLRLHTTAVDVLQALMEAVAESLATLYRLLEPLLPEKHTIVVSGGALVNSVVWRQMLATALDRPLWLVDAEEATSRGAALLAWQALGELPDLTSVTPPLRPALTD